MTPLWEDPAAAPAGSVWGENVEDGWSFVAMMMDDGVVSTPYSDGPKTYRKMYNLVLGRVDYVGVTSWYAANCVRIA